MLRIFRRGWEMVRLAGSRESLPEDPLAHPPGQTVLGSLLEWLFKPEDLPRDTVPPSRRKGFFQTILARESLPQDTPESDRS